MLVETLKNKLNESVKSHNENAKNILRVVLGEIQLIDPKKINDQAVVEIIKKVAKNNDQMIGYGGDRAVICKKENVVLEQFLPKYLPFEEVSGFFSTIKPEIGAEVTNADSEGKALGIAIKALKSSGLSTRIEDVKKVVIDRRMP